MKANHQRFSGNLVTVLVMYSKYIVLKKTGAALHLWSQPDGAENTLKGERAELTEAFTLPYPVFLRVYLYFRNPLALPCVKTAFFEIPVFPPTQTERKKEISPNSELQTPRRTI